LKSSSFRQTFFELLKFGIVGLSGVFVDMAVVVFCREMFGLDERLGALPAFVLAVTWNYELNRRYTFTHKPENWWRSYLSFVVVGLLGLGVRLATMHVLIAWLGMTAAKTFKLGPLVLSFLRLSYVASFLGIVAAYLFNFIGSKYWAFAPSAETTDASADKTDPPPPT
jgi:putative flippase GtrA